MGLVEDGDVPSTVMEELVAEKECHGEAVKRGSMYCQIFNGKQGFWLSSC